MHRIIVKHFGGPEALQLVEEPDPVPGPDQVRVVLTSVGMNHADLMARKGQYKLSSGDPPFTPGLEGGGIIDMLGSRVRDRQLAQRVILAPDAPRTREQGGRTGSVGIGTYRSHFICSAEQAIPAPEQVDNIQLGALWLTYLTAWGCLAWRQNLQPGQTVGIPAASSGVGLAAAQVVRKLGGIPIGLTSSPEKIPKLNAMLHADFEHILLSHRDEDRPEWVRTVKEITDGRGIDVFLDPITAAAELSAEIHALAQNGAIWVYGLLGQAGGPIDMQPLIRKSASIRGWSLSELIHAGGEPMARGCQFVLDGWRDGSFRQHVERIFPLSQAREAHEYMEQGRHIGKLVISP